MCNDGCRSIPLMVLLVLFLLEVQCEYTSCTISHEPCFCYQYANKQLETGLLARNPQQLAGPYSIMLVFHSRISCCIHPTSQISPGVGIQEKLAKTAQFITTHKWYIWLYMMLCIPRVRFPSSWLRLTPCLLAAQHSTTFKTFAPRSKRGTNSPQSSLANVVRDN